MSSLEEIKDAIGADTLSFREGIFTARRGFFYSHGGSSNQFAEKIRNRIKNAVILDHGEVWKPFRGGAPVAKQSHWWVKFTTRR